MGLAEKRIQQEYETTKIPENLAYYVKQTGGATANIQVVIDWASLGDDKQAYENLDSVWLQPLQGIEEVCKDDLGKAGVKESLKKIIIKNVSTPTSVELKDGVLTASMNLKAGSGDALGWTAYQKAVENGL
jgi:hypothetical protein